MYGFHPDGVERENDSRGIPRPSPMLVSAIVDLDDLEGLVGEDRRINAESNENEELLELRYQT